MKKFTEIVEKWLKKYFLYVADAPIEKGIITGAILFTSMLILIMVFFFNSEWIILNLTGAALTISAYVTIFLSAINFIVIKFKITAFKQDEQKIILIYTEKNKVEFYQKPLWGKFQYKIIKLPKNWTLPLCKNSDNKLDVKMNIRANKLFVDLHFKLDFSFSSEFDPVDLSTLILCQSKAKEKDYRFLFRECIEYLFCIYNTQLENPKQLEKIIHNWLNSTKSRAELIEEIQKRISFPTVLFGNAEVKINLLNVEMRLATIF